MIVTSLSLEGLGTDIYIQLDNTLHPPGEIVIKKWQRQTGLTRCKFSITPSFEYFLVMRIVLERYHPNMVSRLSALDSSDIRHIYAFEHIRV